jgi:hypothetical protein
MIAVALSKSVDAILNMPGEIEKIKSDPKYFVKDHRYCTALIRMLLASESTTNRKMEILNRINNELKNGKLKGIIANISDKPNEYKLYDLGQVNGLEAEFINGKLWSSDYNKPAYFLTPYNISLAIANILNTIVAEYEKLQKPVKSGGGVQINWAIIVCCLIVLLLYFICKTSEINDFFSVLISCLSGGLLYRITS